ncbi:hypothetical protein P4B35_19045 [Pontiellaceae bacterium B12227]|nr:hypothetical protein [Pontiellaceae bacterium B12227]
MTKKLILLLLMTSVLVGCATLGPDQRSELDRMGADAIEQLKEKNPELSDVLDAGQGYLIVDIKVVKVPVLGGGGGKGVVVEKATGRRTYVKVSRIELGGGWGARTYKVLLAFTDPKLLKKVQAGTWAYQIGAEASAGKAAIEGSSQQLDAHKGYQLYTLSEGGASATWTIRTIRLKPYRD